MGIFTAAAIQMRSGTEPQRNAADFEALVREAAGKGATYVQTPEMTGAIVRDRRARGARLQARGARRDRRGGQAACRPSSASSCMSARRPSSGRRQARQPRAAVFARGRAASPATTRSTCSTSISTMARAGANRRPMSPAREAVVADIGVGQARPRHLLRSALPAAVPRRGAGRRRRADRSRRLHPPDRPGALARAAARPRDRERRLRHRRRAGRPARGWPRDVRPFADRRPLGQGARRGRP